MSAFLTTGLLLKHIHCAIRKAAKNWGQTRGSVSQQGCTMSNHWLDSIQIYTKQVQTTLAYTSCAPAWDLVNLISAKKSLHKMCWHLLSPLQVICSVCVCTVIWFLSVFSLVICSVCVCTVIWFFVSVFLGHLVSWSCSVGRFGWSVGQLVSRSCCQLVMFSWSVGQLVSRSVGQ